MAYEPRKGVPPCPSRTSMAGTARLWGGWRAFASCTVTAEAVSGCSVRKPTSLIVAWDSAKGASRQLSCLWSSWV
jgi:hypothetical protein